MLRKVKRREKKEKTRQVKRVIGKGVIRNRRRNRKGYKRIKVRRKEEKDGSNWRREEVYRKERKEIRVRRDGDSSHLRNEIFAQFDNDCRIQAC